MAPSAAAAAHAARVAHQVSPRIQPSARTPSKLAQQEAAAQKAKAVPRVRPRGIGRYQADVGEFMEKLSVQITVASLIGGNFFCNMVEKQFDPEGNKMSDGFGVFELFFNICFTIELGLNMYAQLPYKFWKSGWNLFDFVVVSIGLLTTFQVPLPGPFAMLRMMRAFRVFRLFKRVKSLNKVIKSLAAAVPGMLNALFILFLVMCIYSILAVDFFMDYGAGGSYKNEGGADVEFETSRAQDYGHEYFGNFLKSLYTMFQVLTGDSWSEAIARPLIHGNDPVMSLGAAFFFVSYILVNAVVLINVVVAVLLEKMVDPEAAEAQDEAATPLMNSPAKDGEFDAYKAWETEEEDKETDADPLSKENLAKMEERRLARLAAATATASEPKAATENGGSDMPDKPLKPRLPSLSALSSTDTLNPPDDPETPAATKRTPLTAVKADVTHLKADMASIKSQILAIQKAVNQKRPSPSAAA